MVLHHGQEDLCFWNSRCLTSFAVLPDFARVFTNLSYIQLGIAFVFIVRKHRNATHSILHGMTPKNVIRLFPSCSFTDISNMIILLLVETYKYVCSGCQRS